jgi:ribose transport system permease protein
MTTLDSEPTAQNDAAVPTRRPWRLSVTGSVVVPGLVLLSAVMIGYTWLDSGSASVGSLVRSLVVISVVPIVVVFGQSLVVLTGGLDLSVPWVMTMGGLYVTWLYQSTGSALVSIVVVIAMGAVVGALNGVGVAVLGVPAVVMTLGMNMALQGAVLLHTGGVPRGDAPELLRSVMNGRAVLSLPNSLWVAVVLVLLGTILFKATTFGRRVYATGDSARAARTAGIAVRRTLVGVYALSSVGAVIAGMLLVGYTQRSFVGMGDAYLLPSIAAVVIGGASVLGGRGGYPQAVAGVVFLSALTIALGSQSSEAVRQIVFGAVILVSALIFNRQVSRR